MLVTWVSPEYCRACGEGVSDNVYIMRYADLIIRVDPRSSVVGMPKLDFHKGVASVQRALVL